jgi:hypothetical protein
LPRSIQPIRNSASSGSYGLWVVFSFRSQFLLIPLKVQFPPQSPAYVYYPPSERPQAGLHIEKPCDPIKKVYLPSRDTRKCLGRLALCWDGRHFTGSEYEFGRFIYRDTSTKRLGFHRKVGVSRRRRTNQSGWNNKASRAGSWTGTEVYSRERTRQATPRQIDGQASPIVLICGYLTTLAFQSS